MCEVAGAIDLEVYRKTVRGPKKPKPKKKHKKRSVHVSSAKILAQRHQQSACWKGRPGDFCYYSG